MNVQYVYLFIYNILYTHTYTPIVMHVCLQNVYKITTQLHRFQEASMCSTAPALDYR